MSHQGHNIGQCQHHDCLQELLKTANLPACKIQYNQGWDPEISLQQALVESINSDIMLGYTSRGPHRSDLAISVDSIPAKHLLSRGQIKLMTCAMLLARAKLLQQQHGMDCILLIDDLPAELDIKARQWLLDTLQQLESHLMMRHYDGFLTKGKIRGRRRM